MQRGKEDIIQNADLPPPSYKDSVGITSKMDGLEVQKAGGFSFAVRPIERHGCDAFLHFLFNPETGEILGRTILSWLLITVFYIIFYAFLATFFLVHLMGYMTTIPHDRPKYTTLIGENPGLSIRPVDEWRESTLIWFRHGKFNGNWDHYTDRLNNYMDQYISRGEGEIDWPMEDCAYPSLNSLCRINSWESWLQGPCTPENNFGFASGQPCILIKLNKIFDWTPEPYESEYDMPENIPDSIRESFKKNVANNDHDLNNRVWLECEGNQVSDRENLGEISYYPTNGISKNFFPYQNQPRYLPPFIFANIKNSRRGVLITIKCKAWARNIWHDSKSNRGLVKFELMID